MSEVVQSALTCPSCGGPCTEAMEETEMLYGGDDGVTLLVNEIVITCSSPKCAETFSDWRAEEAREKVTQNYRRVFAGPFVDLLARYLPFAKGRLMELMLCQDASKSAEAKAHLANLKTVDAALAAIFVYEPPPKAHVVKDWLYSFAMARIDELMFTDPDKDTPAGIELAGLVNIADLYERELFPTRETQA